MTFLRLGLWLLRRERASGEWRVLLLALIIGVGSVSTTGFLGDRIKRAMSEQGASFLGADLLVTSPRPIETWPAPSDCKPAARSNSPAWSAVATPSSSPPCARSMPPIRCAARVRIADRPFEAGTPRPAQPPPGAIYVDQELLALLDAQVGDTVQIGEATFRIAGVVAEEPGQLGGVFGFAPRVFLRADEVERTRVLQPGSRAHLSLPVCGRTRAARGFQRRAETRTRQHPAPDRFARRRRNPARRLRQRRPLHPAHRADQPAAVGGRHRHRRASPRAAPLRPGGAAALLRRHHRATAHALCRPVADAGAARQPARRGDRRADAAGAGGADPAGCRHPPAVAWPGAGRRRRRQRPAGAGGRQPARADAPDPRAAAARPAARPAAAAGWPPGSAQRSAARRC